MENKLSLATMAKPRTQYLFPWAHAYAQYVFVLANYACPVGHNLARLT
jgi:hypothetical protein